MSTHAIVCRVSGRTITPVHAMQVLNGRTHHLTSWHAGYFNREVSCSTQLQAWQMLRWVHAATVLCCCPWLTVRKNLDVPDKTASNVSPAGHSLCTLMQEKFNTCLNSKPTCADYIQAPTYNT